MIKENFKRQITTKGDFLLYTCVCVQCIAPLKIQASNRHKRQIETGSNSTDLRTHFIENKILCQFVLWLIIFLTKEQANAGQL
jgi:hypothetical protein